MIVPLAFSVPFPVVILGMITGMSYGLLAVGLVLVYRSNRLINFAHGEIGAFGAVLMALVVVRWHIWFWLAFPVAILVAAGVGAGSEVAVVRRLRSSPPIMSVVATLGLAEFLTVFALVIDGQVGSGAQFPQPPGLPKFGIGALNVTPAYSGLLFLSPLLVIGLVVFLRKTRYGLGIRAAAANPDAARLSSISASRMSTLSWAIAGGVSAFTAILVIPAEGLQAGSGVGPTLLLRALVPAVLGQMVSLPIALAGGVAVGVLEQILLWNDPRGGSVNAILFAVVLVALLWQRRGGGRSQTSEQWRTVSSWRPVVAELRQHPVVRNLGRIVAATTVFVLLLLPIVITNATSVILVTMAAFSLVGLSVAIITGLAGQLSLGQFAIAGIGAAVSYFVSYDTGNFFLSFFCAGLAAAAVSVIIGLPAMRIRGLMLAVTTLGFGLAAQSWLFAQSWMFGSGVDPGRPIINGFTFDTGRSYYFIALLVLVVGFWLAHNVWTSGFGRRLRAQRDNDDVARAFTIPTIAVRLQGFAVAGFLAGLGGATYGHLLAQLDPSAFPIGTSIDVTAMAVIGGIGLLSGPLLGALYIVGIPSFLPLDNAGLAATGLGWLVFVVYVPGGVAQLLRPVRDVIVRLIAGKPSTAAVEVETEVFAKPKLEATTRYPATTEPVLRARGLAKAFGGVHAVDGVDLTVGPGEVVGLIGPNGAGKTTLFEILAGFTRADAGTVELLGHDVTRSSPEARGRLGLIRSFQDAALFPTLTVHEVVTLAHERLQPDSFARSLAGVRSIDRKKRADADELINMMGLTFYRETEVGALSTGTRRIAELACMIALQPRILLLDEPSSGIAQREGEALGGLLLRLKGYLDASLIVIEHDIPLVSSIADRMVCMESGRVLAVGSPQEVLSNDEVIDAYLGGDVRAIQRSGQAGAGEPAAPRSAPRRAVRPPSPRALPRCEGTTRNGDQCSRRPGEDGLCSQHRALAGASR